jgi:serine protease Do
MRRTPLLTLAATAALTALPAGAQETRIYRAPRAEAEGWFANENRAAIGVSTTATGTLRDTLGLMITNVTRGGPAERAGLEEGNRLQAINGVNLRANAADIEDTELSGSLSRRLTRELSKARPGDEVELRVYRDGRTQAVRVKTVDSDSLFRRREAVRYTRADADERPTLGIGIQSSGSRRDTLGVLIVSVGDSTPAERAGLEEGNRIAAINGVNLRVAREDAGDPYLSSAKAQRLQREIAQLKPGSDATLRIYSNGQFRDVRVRVARAGDLPRRSRVFFGRGMGGMMAPMPPMPPMPAMPSSPRVRGWPSESIHLEFGPAIEDALHEAGIQLERVGPQVERALRELPRALRGVRVPNVSIDVAAPRVSTVTMN